MEYKSEGSGRGRVRQVVGMGFLVGGGMLCGRTTKEDSIASAEGGSFTVNTAWVKDSLGTASPSGPGPCPKSIYGADKMLP
jgi:hypothetical protein